MDLKICPDCVQAFWVCSLFYFPTGDFTSGNYRFLLQLWLVAHWAWGTAVPWDFHQRPGHSLSCLFWIFVFWIPDVSCSSFLSCLHVDICWKFPKKRKIQELFCLKMSFCVLTFSDGLTSYTISDSKLFPLE